MSSSTKKSKKELRKFALVMAVALTIIGGIALWRERSWGEYVLYVALFFLLSGRIYPRLLTPIEWTWMKMAHYLSLVMTFVILTLTFYIVITPIGLFMRLIGKDMLSLKLEPEKESYWLKVDPNGSGSRSDKPY